MRMQRKVVVRFTVNSRDKNTRQLAKNALRWLGWERHKVSGIEIEVQDPEGRYQLFAIRRKKRTAARGGEYDGS